MRRSSIVIILIFIALGSFAQSIQSRFERALRRSVTETSSILEEWKENGPMCGDYYLALFEYGWEFSLFLSDSRGPDLPLYGWADIPFFPDEDVASLNQKCHYSKLVITNQIRYDTAIRNLDTGVEHYPRRFDLRFAQADMALYQCDADKLLKSLDQAFEWLKDNPNAAPSVRYDRTISADSAYKELELRLVRGMRGCARVGTHRQLDRLLKLAYQYYPENEEVMLLKYSRLKAQKKHRAARLLLKKIKQKYPDDKRLERLNRSPADSILPIAIWMVSISCVVLLSLYVLVFAAPYLRFR